MNPISELSQEVELFEYKSPMREGILGTVSGPFFFPNVASRNRRVYPEEAWKNALGNAHTKRLLENNLMLGTVGHKDMEFDDLISEQKVSHLTRKLWTENKNGKVIGMGEADILDTPVGRILNTLIRAGCKMAISSKSYGEYQESKDSSGNQIVDPKKFYCQRFDFVVDPGFLEAMPQLKEEFEKLVNEEPTEKMDEKHIVELIEEKIKDRENFIYSINMEDKVMDEKLLKLTEDKTRLEEQIGQVLKDNENLKSTITGLQSLGTPEVIKEAFDKVKSLTTVVDSYKEIGTPEEITETLEKSKSFVTSIAEFGTVEEIKEAFDTVTAYVEIGTPEEIKESLEKIQDLIEKFEPIGTFSSIKEALESARDVLKEYAEIGKPDEIKEAFEKADKVITKVQEDKTKTEVDGLVAKFGITEDKAKSLLAKMTVEEVEGTLAEMKEAVKITGRYRKSINEDGKEVEKPVASRTTKLFESFGSVKS